MTHVHDMSDRVFEHFASTGAVEHCVPAWSEFMRTCSLLSDANPRNWKVYTLYSTSKYTQFFVPSKDGTLFLPEIDVVNGGLSCTRWQYEEFLVYYARETLQIVAPRLTWCRHEALTGEKSPNALWLPVPVTKFGSGSTGWESELKARKRHDIARSRLPGYQSQRITDPDSLIDFAFTACATHSRWSAEEIDYAYDQVRFALFLVKHRPEDAVGVETVLNGKTIAIGIAIKRSDRYYSFSAMCSLGGYPSVGVFTLTSLTSLIQDLGIADYFDPVARPEFERSSYNNYKLCVGNAVDDRAFYYLMGHGEKCFADPPYWKHDIGWVRSTVTNTDTEVKSED